MFQSGIMRAEDSKDPILQRVSLMRQGNFLSVYLSLYLSTLLHRVRIFRKQYFIVGSRRFYADYGLLVSLEPSDDRFYKTLGSNKFIACVCENMHIFQ